MSHATHGHSSHGSHAAHASAVEPILGVPKEGAKVKYVPDGLPDEEWPGTIIAANTDGTVDLLVEPKEPKGAPKETKTGVLVVQHGEKEKPKDRYCTL